MPIIKSIKFFFVCIIKMVFNMMSMNSGYTELKTTRVEYIVGLIGLFVVIPLLALLIIGIAYLFNP